MFWKFRNPGSCRKDNGWIRLHGGLLWCYWMLETQGPNHGLGKPHQSMAGPRAERSSPGEESEIGGLLFDATYQGNVPHWTVSWLNWFLSCLMIHIALWCCWSYCFLFCFICLFFPGFICLCSAKTSHFLFQFTFRGSSTETPVR